MPHFRKTEVMDDQLKEGGFGLSCVYDRSKLLIEPWEASDLRYRGLRVRGMGTDHEAGEPADATLFINDEDARALFGWLGTYLHGGLNGQG